MAGRARLFVGLGLGGELGGRALAPVAASLDAGAWRLPRAEGLHLTLEFLGETPESEVDRMVEALEHGLSGARAVGLQILINSMCKA